MLLWRVCFAVQSFFRSAKSRFLEEVGGIKRTTVFVIGLTITVLLILVCIVFRNDITVWLDQLFFTTAEPFTEESFFVPPESINE